MTRSWRTLSKSVELTWTWKGWWIWEWHWWWLGMMWTFFEFLKVSLNGILYFWGQDYAFIWHIFPPYHGQKVVVFRTAVKEGGAGGEGRKAASSNLSLNNSACCRNSSPLLFFKHFSPLQLVDSLRKGKCALFESRPVSLSSTGNASAPPSPPPPLGKSLKWRRQIFSVSPLPSLPLPPHKASVSLTKEENSCRSNGRCQLPPQRTAADGTGVVGGCIGWGSSQPAQPNSQLVSPQMVSATWKGAAEGGERERERAESAAAALLAPHPPSPSSPAQKAPSYTSKKQDRWIEQFVDNFESSAERLPENAIISVVNKHL